MDKLDLRQKTERIRCLVNERDCLKNTLIVRFNDLPTIWLVHAKKQLRRYREISSEIDSLKKELGL